MAQQANERAFNFNQTRASRLERTNARNLSHLQETLEVDLKSMKCYLDVKGCSIIDKPLDSMVSMVC